MRLDVCGHRIVGMTVNYPASQVTSLESTVLDEPGIALWWCWRGPRIIFPEIFEISRINGGINAGTDIPFAANGKSDCFRSCCSPKIGFLGPGIGGRVIFPEILLKDETTIRAGTDITFAADGKSHSS